MKWQYICHFFDDRLNLQKSLTKKKIESYLIGDENKGRIGSLK